MFKGYLHKTLLTACASLMVPLHAMAAPNGFSVPNFNPYGIPSGGAGQGAGPRDPAIAEAGIVAEARETTTQEAANPAGRVDTQGEAPQGQAPNPEAGPIGQGSNQKESAKMKTSTTLSEVASSQSMATRATTIASSDLVLTTTGMGLIDPALANGVAHALSFGAQYASASAAGMNQYDASERTDLENCIARVMREKSVTRFNAVEFCTNEQDAALMPDREKVNGRKFRTFQYDPAHPEYRRPFATSGTPTAEELSIRLTDYLYTAQINALEMSAAQGAGTTAAPIARLDQQRTAFRRDLGDLLWRKIPVADDQPERLAIIPVQPTSGIPVEGLRFRLIEQRWNALHQLMFEMCSFKFNGFQAQGARLGWLPDYDSNGVPSPRFNGADIWGRPQIRQLMIAASSPQVMMTPDVIKALYDTWEKESAGYGLSGNLPVSDNRGSASLPPGQRGERNTCEGLAPSADLSNLSRIMSLINSSNETEARAARASLLARPRFRAVYAIAEAGANSDLLYSLGQIEGSIETSNVPTFDELKRAKAKQFLRAALAMAKVPLTAPTIKQEWFAQMQRATKINQAVAAKWQVEVSKAGENLQQLFQGGTGLGRNVADNSGGN